jgi:TonB family protein
VVGNIFWLLVFVGASYSQPVLQSQKSEPPLSGDGSIRILSNTEGVDFHQYLSRVKYVINSNWHSLVPEDAAAKSGTVVIRFTVLRDGSVTGIQIEKSSGDTTLDRPAYAAITNSQPFSPLPDAFHGNYLALRINFQYNPKPGEAQPANTLPQATSSRSPAQKSASPFNVSPGIDYSSQRPSLPEAENGNESPSSQSIDIIEPKGPASYELQEFLRQRLLVVLRRNWINVIPDKARGKKGKRGTAIVIFKIEKDGTFDSIELEQSSDDPDLDHAALEAVNESSPTPLPEKFTSKYLKLRVKFLYNPPKETVKRYSDDPNR